MDELPSLVIRAQAGELDAYAEIVRRFQDMAYGYAYSLLGDFHLAEDAAQEAFVEAYRCLDNLREPAAFPGWFRRIVFKHCDRLTRGRRMPAVALDAASGVASKGNCPAANAEHREMRVKVLEAIRGLPEPERTATTLFYINGYSQETIAEFLDVPAGTIKSRLHRSRKRLKQRMLTMVEETLHTSVPDERFSRKVIEELLARPRPLEIEGHPTREIACAMREALSDYELIEGQEVVDKTSYGVGSGLPDAYHVDDSRVLRPETTVTTFGAMIGRTPPVRIITVGRVFRDNAEDSIHSHIFHQLEALCVETGANERAMQEAIERTIRSAVPEVDLRWEAGDFTYPKVDSPQEVFIRCQEQWIEIAGCGMLTAEMLRETGYDPQAVSGFAFGLGLERIAMLKHGIDDIRKLWSPPYVPK